MVVHVDATALSGDKAGRRELEGGVGLHPEVARRLACDSSLVRIVEQDGRPLSVGRRTRSVPPAIKRALRARDRGCRFPGCTERRFVDAHHIQHWSHGGETKLSNLVQLCRRHHRLVHEGGFRLEGGRAGLVKFRRPDGRVIPTRPRLREGDCSRLAERNAQRGRSIQAHTCVPECGDRLDLLMTVDSLVTADPRLREPPMAAPVVAADE